jgi:hypothetical protein
MVDKLKVHKEGVNAVADEARRSGAIDVQIKVIDGARYVSCLLKGSRALIRVRATGDYETVKFEEASFTVYPSDAKKVTTVASARGAVGLFAFVCHRNGAVAIRYEKATKVAARARQAEASYHGISRRYIWFRQLTVCIHQIGKLLAPVSLAA